MLRRILTGSALLVTIALWPAVAYANTAYANPEECMANDSPDDDEEGKELYMRACATCHGADGAGNDIAELGFETPPPDFSDCNFATREPDADWIAVAHQGGPVRGFAREMPAFGDALTEAELQKILNHIRTFCTEDEWPRGELNLPRAFVTEKAYPEDETVVSTSIDTEGSSSAITEIVYEKRFGARSQVEVVVPVGMNADASGALLGDVALGFKRVVRHSLSSGSIFSLGGEIILPTGDSDLGIGNGTTKFEPFASFGQGLFADLFLQIQSGLELPLDQDQSSNELFVNSVIGRTFTQGKWGRAWSPMVEMIAVRDLASSSLHVDIAPQVQIALNQRQHVMLNVGLRVPTDRSIGTTQFMVYLLWEWFDGGFFEGW